VQSHRKMMEPRLEESSLVEAHDSGVIDQPRAPTTVLLCTRMKSLSIFRFFALLLLSSGCFPLTEMVRERAEGYTRVNKKTEEHESVLGSPAYYALTTSGHSGRCCADADFGARLRCMVGAWFPRFHGPLMSTQRPGHRVVIFEPCGNCWMFPIA
jgi:hypothetical protein